jgi:hypothetical protein
MRDRPIFRQARLLPAKDIPPRQFPDYIRLTTCCRVTDLNQLRKELKAAGYKPTPGSPP